MATWALDLDGVIWTGIDPIPGASKAVELLRAAGHEVVFVTNNSFATIGEQEAKLGRFGIDAVDVVITSAQAGASLVAADDRVFVLGGPGIREALNERDIEVLDAEQVENGGLDQVDAVLVGLDWDLSYDRLRIACQAILGGARFIATNADPTYPTERGLFPGAGALVAAVSAATHQEPTIAGKPHHAQAALVRARFGTEGVMVGDRPDTDGLFAASLGYEFGLVFSGVTQPSDLPVDPEPAHTAPDLLSLVERLCS